MTQSVSYDVVTDVVNQKPRGLQLFETIKDRMGWDEEYLARINDPTHPKLKDMDRLTFTLEHLRQNGMRLVIVPDFDTDGICSGIILYAGLSELGLDVELHVPDYHLGHEILPEVIDTVVQEYPGVKAVITCDAGTNSAAALDRANELGLLTIVTDHHVEEEPSHAHVLVNPNRIDETYPNKEICGSHVAYQVVEEYASRYRSEQVSAITWLKVFAGIGTVADVMSLVYENRDLVRESLMLTRLLIPVPELPNPLPGDPADDEEVVIDHTSTLLSMLRSQNHHPVYMRAFEGLTYMLRELGTTVENVNEQLYGFTIAPSFNSVRRVDGDYRTGFMLFTSNDPEQQKLAAHHLVEYNNMRKEKVRELVDRINSVEQPWGPYVYPVNTLNGVWGPYVCPTDTPNGMLGLIAQNFMLANGNPVAVVSIHSDGSCSGSVRSPQWFPVISEVAKYGNPNIEARGHEYACGIAASSVDELYQMFATCVPARQEEILSSGVALVQDPPAALHISNAKGADATLHEIGAISRCVQLLDGLGPFGHGFEAPPIDVTVYLPSCNIRTLGNQQQHVKITTPEGIALLWWNRSDVYDDLMARKQTMDVLAATATFRVSLSINNFRGNSTLQGVIDHEC